MLIVLYFILGVNYITIMWFLVTYCIYIKQITFRPEPEKMDEIQIEIKCQFDKELIDVRNVVKSVHMLFFC